MDSILLAYRDESADRVELLKQAALERLRLAAARRLAEPGPRLSLVGYHLPPRLSGAL